ncbi:MAG: dihydrofolate reductase [Parvularculaceae bacterium]
MIRIALVVAVSENGVIGREGKLPWRISDDLKWFKKVTSGKPVIMGRKTFASLPGALPERTNIVITRSKFWSAPDAVRAGGLDEALALAAEDASARHVDEICIIGGAEIYAQTLGRAGRIYLTRVHAKVDGDAHFPELAKSAWRQTAAGGCEAGPKNAYSCDFFILDRLQAGGRDEPAAAQ